MDRKDQNRTMAYPVTIIIPSLNPDEKLLKVVSAAASGGFSRLILVDDGSAEENRHYFTRALEIAQEEGLPATLLRHAKNLGKGRALKTAFNDYLSNPQGCVGAVTVDGDNQHCIEDVQRCAQCLTEHPDTVFLGARDFSLDNVPPRSRFGNRFTSFLFRFACGLKISDTQTGLRAIPNRWMEDFLDLVGERFEYETNMLLEMKTKNIPFREIPIQTVYLEENKSSHFNPLKDSMRIMGVLFRFLAASGASWGVDILLFTLLQFLFRGLSITMSVFLSTAVARIASSLINLSLNRTVVFRQKGGLGRTVIRYYILCGIQLMASAGLVSLLLHFLGRAWSLPVKLCVDTLLFLASFQVQREWVFRR